MTAKHCDLCGKNPINFSDEWLRLEPAPGRGGLTCADCDKKLRSGGASLGPADMRIGQMKGIFQGIAGALKAVNHPVPELWWNRHIDRDKNHTEEYYAIPPGTV